MLSWSSCLSKGGTVPIPPVTLQRFVACAATLAVFAAMATTPPPTARAADGRELLANAIATTRGAYLVYNFGGGAPAPMLNARGGWYEMSNGGHLMIIKFASQRLAPRLLVDSHSGYQARCERDGGARTGEGLWQASEIYAPLQAWQALGQPTIAINANFFDVRGQQGGSWRDTKCSSPLGAYVDNTRGQGRANAAVTGTVTYAGKQGLSGGNEHWSSLATMILPVGAQPYVVMPKGPDDYDSASPRRETWANSTTADPARHERRSPTTAQAISCTSSRAAVTHRTRFRTCSVGSAPTPLCCSTAAGRR